MNENQWPRRVIDWVSAQRRKRRRPKRIWEDSRRNAMAGRYLEAKDWRN